jgi:hypothetical protein
MPERKRLTLAGALILKQVARALDDVAARFRLTPGSKTNSVSLFARRKATAARQSFYSLAFQLISIAN